MSARIRIDAFVWLALVFSGLVACDGSSPSSQTMANREENEPAIEDLIVAPVSVTELNLAFRREYPPDIVYVLNEVKKSKVQFEVIELVSCAYQMCEQAHSDWDRDALGNDLVRVNLLDVLVQARAQGIDFTAGISVREDTIELLTNRNPFVVQQALLVMSYIGGRADIANIESVAINTSDDVTLRHAILALKLMTAPGAEDAIDRIIASLDERKAEQVLDLVNQEF